MPDNIEHISDKLRSYKDRGLRLFTTSSFQTQSVVLLHILSKTDRSIPVYFLNTGYHFPETVAYKEELVSLFGLKVTDVFSGTPRHMQRDEKGNLLFTSDPDFCCYLNKVEPMDALLAKYDVWVNGVRADQSAVRRNMHEEEKTPQGALRWHPMLEWTAKMIYDYIREHNLPKHPLEEKGYMSIGCEPCTRRVIPGAGSRDGRWFGLNKTECGLHTEFTAQK